MAKAPELTINNLKRAVDHMEALRKSIIFKMSSSLTQAQAHVGLLNTITKELELLNEELESLTPTAKRGRPAKEETVEVTEG
jgi:hypothetical protein